ncbi:MAG: 4Fe-4S dicluster domain-containing protein [Candidatus Methylomirabilia bacterium]
MSEINYRELKCGGVMRQKGDDRFLVRLHMVAGGLSSGQARAVAEAADQFGSGALHLTSRQGIEIPDVSSAALTGLKEFLAPHGIGFGVCGPTVRGVTACQGCRVCPNGVIDSPSLADAVDRAFYGKQAPHKFKVGISGCANNCLKAEENDLGVKGWIEPRWNGDGCTGCGLCVAICPVKAVRFTGEGGSVEIESSRCIGCGDCIVSCPSASMAEKARGFRVFVGGKLGRVPFLGQPVFGVLTGTEEILAVIEEALEFFRLHGRARERFGDTLQRVGFEALEAYAGATARRVA